MFHPFLSFRIIVKQINIRRVQRLRPTPTQLLVAPCSCGQHLARPRPAGAESLQTKVLLASGYRLQNQRGRQVLGKIPIQEVDARGVIGMPCEA